MSELPLHFMVLHKLTITPVRCTLYYDRTNCDGDYLTCIVKVEYAKKKLGKNKGKIKARNWKRMKKNNQESRREYREAQKERKKDAVERKRDTERERIEKVRSVPGRKR